MHEINVTGYNAATEEKPLNFGTAASYGVEKLHITFDAAWDDLTKSATFNCGKPGRGLRPVTRMIDEDGIVDVPQEATAVATKDGTITLLGVAPGSVSALTFPILLRAMLRCRARQQKISLAPLSKSWQQRKVPKRPLKKRRKQPEQPRMKLRRAQRRHPSKLPPAHKQLKRAPPRPRHQPARPSGTAPMPGSTPSRQRTQWRWDSRPPEMHEPIGWQRSRPSRRLPNMSRQLKTRQRTRARPKLPQRAAPRQPLKAPSLPSSRLTRRENLPSLPKVQPIQPLRPRQMQWMPRQLPKMRRTKL